jgi:hypothetical protein
MPDMDAPYPGWPEFEYVCDSANSGSHGPAFCGLGPGPDCPWCTRKVVMTPEWEAFIQDTPNRHQRMAEAMLGNPEIKASLRRHSRYNRGESQERMMAMADLRERLQQEEAKFQQFKKDTGIDDDVEALLENIRRSHAEMTRFNLNIKPIIEGVILDAAQAQEKAAAVTRTGQRELRRAQRRLFWDFVRTTIKDTVREYFSPITRWFGRKR